MPVQQRAQKKMYQKATLYAVIFDSLTVKMCVLVLFALLLIQPIAPAYAFVEEEGGSVEEETVIVSDPVFIVDESLVEAVVDSGEASDAAVATDVVEGGENGEGETAQILSEVSVDAVSNEGDGTVSIANQADDAEQSGATASDVYIATTTEIIDEETATTTEEETVEEVSIEEEVIDSEPLEDSSASTTATTSQPLQSVHNASAFSFDTTECAVVGDGAYYCSDKKAETEVFEDGVFSAPDTDGDMEIFIRVGGEEQQITHNKTDDSAPRYDAVSGRIVWHSMINDRYQVMSYDGETKDITRFTSATYNNMEPVAYGGVTLWQAWIDNNWEIILFDGQTQRQITNNTQNDVSPHMREGYIVWQTQFEDAWQVAVYDQETKKVEYIASEGGLKVENPRFVLVYDSSDENGDMKTVGYDFDSKSSFDLGVLPQELPDELPEPDQTGETRALIQNKQTSREGEQEVIDITPVDSGTGSTTNEGTTLDLSQGHATSSHAMTNGVIEDVSVPSYTDTATSSQDIFTIEDVVIPPFASTSSEQVS
jgi:hypothetical protein